jgi:hypothetical protein
MVKGIIGTALLAVVLLWTEGFSGCRYEKAVKLKTPAWGCYGSLLVRRESDEGNALLLRFSTENYRLEQARQAGDKVDPGVIYRYTPGATHLESTVMEKWDDASGVIVQCSGGGGRVPDPFGTDLRTKRLTFKDRAVDTVGRTVMGKWGAHSGDLVAVQTAGVDLGLNWPGLSFLGGGGPVLGKRYHQFFSKSDGKPRGVRIILSTDSDDYFHKPCWSEDDHFVIYAAFRFEYLCVVANPYRTEKQK